MQKVTEALDAKPASNPQSYKDAINRRLTRSSQSRKDVPPLIKEAMARKAIRKVIVGD